MLIFFEFVISWKDLELTGFFFRNPTTDMSSAAANDVKTAVPIFDGSNYNVWVDQMKFWLQSQCYSTTWLTFIMKVRSVVRSCPFLSPR